MFSFDEATQAVETTTSAKPRFPFPTNPSYGVVAKLVSYTYPDNKDGADLVFEAPNGGTTVRTLWNPSFNKGVPNPPEVISGASKGVANLAKALGITKKPTGTASTWKEFLDGYFGNIDFSTLKPVRVKVGYAKAEQEYEPSKYEGKTEEEIKSTWHPFVNISKSNYWFLDAADKRDFAEFNTYDKVFTNFELVENNTTPSTDDDLPFGSPSNEEDLF